MAAGRGSLGEVPAVGVLTARQLGLPGGSRTAAILGVRAPRPRGAHRARGRGAGVARTRAHSGRAAAVGSGNRVAACLGLEGRVAAGQAGPRLAGPAGWLRRLGQAGHARASGPEAGGRLGWFGWVGPIKPIWLSPFFPISFTLFPFIYCLINSITKCLYAKLN